MCSNCLLEFNYTYKDSLPIFISKTAFRDSTPEKVLGIETCNLNYENKNLIYKNCIDSSSSTTYEYKHDKNGNIIFQKLIYRLPDGFEKSKDQVFESELKYEFNIKGKPEKVYTKQKDTISGYEIINYDKSGNLTQRNYFQSNGNGKFKKSTNESRTYYPNGLLKSIRRRGYNDTREKKLKVDFTYTFY
jgi:hypothetical protein